ncbi:MAG: hypothetical protein QNJ03_09055 [Dinoroseobacter sp.]|nr:hypothetical protein [Dinoroseobacter sp.]
MPNHAKPHRLRPQKSGDRSASPAKANAAQSEHSFCLTHLSVPALVLSALGVSAGLWLMIMAVV